MARLLNVPGLALARAIVAGHIRPDERVGDFVLFERTRAAEIAAKMLTLAKREPARIALKQKLDEFRALGGAEATLFYQQNRDELKLAARLEQTENPAS